jgi:hypothetical protein
VKRVAESALTALGHVLGIHWVFDRRARRARAYPGSRRHRGAHRCRIADRYGERRAVFRRPSGAKSARAKRKRANPPSPNGVPSRNVTYSDANRAIQLGNPANKPSLILLSREDSKRQPRDPLEASENGRETLCGNPIGSLARSFGSEGGLLPRSICVLIDYRPVSGDDFSAFSPDLRVEKNVSHE